MPSRPRRSLCAAALAVSAAALAACGGGGDGDGFAGDYSVEAALGQVPRSAWDEDAMLSTADLDRASELAGADRPDPDTDDLDDVADWLFAVQGQGLGEDDDSPVAALVPEATNPNYLAQFEDFRDEVGWSLLDIGSFVEVSIPPARFTVMAGEFDEDAIDDALGSRDSDGLWTIGGDDFEVDVAERSAARPLGEALRFASDDGLLVESKATRPIEQWVDGDATTLADEDDFVAVARALDGQDVYAAMVIEGNEIVEGGVDPEIEESLGYRALEPFTVLGVGLTVVDDEPVAVLVYQHDSEEAAEENADLLEELFDEGRLTTGTPIAEMFGRLETEVDGTVLIATVPLADDSLPAQVWQMVYRREEFTAYG